MTNPHIGSSLDEWLAEEFTPEEREMIDATAQQRVRTWQNTIKIDETIRIFAQSRVILEQYHAAMQQAHPPIVTRWVTHTTRLADFIATLPAEEQQQVHTDTARLLATWRKQDNRIMRKKLRRCATTMRIL